MGGVCSTHGSDEQCMRLQRFSQDLKGRERTEDLRVIGRIILIQILNKSCFSLSSGHCGSGQRPVAGSCEQCKEFQNIAGTFLSS
jgi:hypothetical protein